MNRVHSDSQLIPWHEEEDTVSAGCVETLSVWNMLRLGAVPSEDDVLGEVGVKLVFTEEINVMTEMRVDTLLIRLEEDL